VDSQDMIGICLTPKSSLAMKYAIDWNLKCKSKQIGNYVIEYLTPLKNKTQINLFKINWVNHFLLQSKENNSIDGVNVLSRFLSERNIPNIALSKISNTIVFFKYIEKYYRNE
jgi:hypothetical protein